MSTEALCVDCGQTYRIGEYPFCPHGRPHGGTLLSAIHTSERAVVYRNPRTGEIRYPARADQAVPEVYARQGYERQELSTPQAVRQFEKETGRLHERSHYDTGSGRADRELTTEPKAPLQDSETTRRKDEVIRSLVQSLS